MSESKLMGTLLCIDRYDRLGCEYIHARIHRMATSHKPAINVKDRSVSLTQFGEEIVLGRASWLSGNVIQEKIAGFNIDSAVESIPNITLDLN